MTETPTHRSQTRRTPLQQPACQNIPYAFSRACALATEEATATQVILSGIRRHDVIHSSLARGPVSVSSATVTVAPEQSLVHLCLAHAAQSGPTCLRRRVIAEHSARNAAPILVSNIESCLTTRTAIARDLRHGLHYDGGAFG